MPVAPPVPVTPPLPDVPPLAGPPPVADPLEPPLAGLPPLPDVAPPVVAAVPPLLALVPPLLAPEAPVPPEPDVAPPVPDGPPSPETGFVSFRSSMPKIAVHEQRSAPIAANEANVTTALGAPIDEPIDDEDERRTQNLPRTSRLPGPMPSATGPSVAFGEVNQSTAPPAMPAAPTMNATVAMLALERAVFAASTPLAPQ